MNLEQLAIIGIAVFSFMALTTAIGAIRSAKRMGSRSEIRRVRRLVGGTESARAVALSIVDEIAKNHRESVTTLKKTGRLDRELENAIAEARVYFLSRVESRHRTLFSKAVDDIIYKNPKTNEGTSPVT